jgi:hypothetical protein
MRFLAFLDLFALPKFRRPPVSYVSEVAQSIERLADMVELVADGLFAIAAGCHTDTLGNQRNMTAVFKSDALERYGDVLKKLTPDQAKQLESFVDGLCKGKRR